MQLFLNNWSTALTLPATASAVQLSVPEADATLLTGLGTGDHYLLTLVQIDAQGLEIAWEIVRVTANTAGVLDVLRGQEGTTALDLEAGTAISARLTQATMETLRDSGGPALSDAAPQPLGAAAPGTSPDASRADHTHALPTPGDIGAATTAQGDKADTAVQPAALTAALTDKVDKVPGKQLSTEDYTTAEKTKLAGLDDAHYKGTYTNLAALETAHPTASPGDYADVDAGVADPVLRYIWDDSDTEWVAQAGSADPVTAAQVKTLYESNADTNAYTDAEKSKLGGIATGATANPDTDSLAESGTPTNKWFTEARVRAALLTGLSLADTAVVAATDSVLQAIGKLAARLATAFDRANHTGSQAISTVTGLQADLDGKQALAPVITDATTARVSVIGDAGGYVRFTNASAATYTIAPQSSVAWATDTEIHIRRAAAGDLTLTPGSGVTLNAPSGGTLVMTDRMSVTLKRVGTDVWDVLGQTVAA